jgi:hypothetical protein
MRNEKEFALLYDKLYGHVNEYKSKANPVTGLGGLWDCEMLRSHIV